MEFTLTYDGDRPVYVVLRRLNDWAVFAPNQSDFVEYVTADLAQYAMPLESRGGDAYSYETSVSVIYGVAYIANYYEQAGDDPDESNDLLLKAAEVTSGTSDVVIVADSGEDPTAEFDIVRPGIPNKDGCPILTRLMAFIVPETVNAAVEFTFRDRSGEPIDLTQTLTATSSTSQSSASVGDSAELVQVVVREYTGTGAGDAGIVISIPGTLYDPENGVVRANLPREVVGQSGLYLMDFGYYRGNRLRLQNRSLLSVEPNIFGLLTTRGNTLAAHREGCPTLQEIRMQMWDSSGAENLLLDDLEFADEQILLALAKPIQVFNTSLPPLNVTYNTTNFPFRSQWIDAVIGYLYQFAAAFYRRNRLQGAAAGVNVDDLNKEESYLRVSQMHLQAWKDFVLQKKVELNMQACVGSLNSNYGVL